MQYVAKEINIFHMYQSAEYDKIVGESPILAFSSKYCCSDYIQIVTRCQDLVASRKDLVTSRCLAAMNVKFKYRLLFEDLLKFTFTTSPHCYSIDSQHMEMSDWQWPSGKCKLPSWQLVIIRCQRYTPYVQLNLFIDIF